MILAFTTWPAPTVGVDMQSWQDGRCAGCGVRPDILRRQRLVLDHDHGTGLTRGHLCVRCNRMESCSDAPQWVEWRAGRNPGQVYGWGEPYVNMWDTTATYTAVDEDELRAAINRLSA